MPNCDGTGPDGQGPMTGRGAGKCKGAKENPQGRCGMRRGAGAGRGRGRNK